MVNVKQPTVYLGYKQSLKLIVLCVRSCMGTKFENAFERNTCKYILKSVDIASKCKVLRALRTKKASEVAFVLEAI